MILQKIFRDQHAKISVDSHIKSGLGKTRKNKKHDNLSYNESLTDIK